MKPLLWIALPLFVAIGCSRPATPTPAPADDGPDPLSVTRWTDTTELFAEYPPLVAGQTSRFAIHLTRLDTFKPLTEGRVEVRLEGGSESPELFPVDAPSRPGIFGVDVKPARAGSRSLVILLRSGDLSDEHHVGTVQVFVDAAAAQAVAPEGDGDPGGSFLKEQQWSLDFATAVVTERRLRESLRIPARIEARADGVANVVTPADGRLTRVANLSLGAQVARGQELARLLPSPAVPGDLPALRLAHVEAVSRLAQAVRDRERAERLTTAGAAPARRLEDARTNEEQARARVAAAEAALKQYNAAQTGEGGDEGLFVVRAPIAGVLAERTAVTGGTVTAGTVLFQIVNSAQVLVVGQIPEQDITRARTAKQSEVEAPGGDRVPAGDLVAVGEILDPRSRTLPMTFALENRARRFAVGQSVSLHLLLESAEAGPTVPATAVVDDAGRPIVFVQRDGETFERRAVTLGARSGGLVQLLEGVMAGERVVAEGAYLVRLASLSTSVPAHGHVH